MSPSVSTGFPLYFDNNIIPKYDNFSKKNVLYNKKFLFFMIIFHFLYYLLLDTGSISVWSCGYSAAENVTEKQKEVLKVLIEKKLTRKTTF